MPNWGDDEGQAPAVVVTGAAGPGRCRGLLRGEGGEGGVFPGGANLARSLSVVCGATRFSHHPVLLVGGKITLGADGALPAPEVTVTDDQKKVVTYTALEDGTIEKKTSTYKIEVRQTLASKKARERRVSALRGPAWWLSAHPQRPPARRGDPPLF